MNNNKQKKPNKQNKDVKPKILTGIWVDIFGVLLILFVPMLYYMCTKTNESGAIGFGIGNCLDFLFGKCKYVFPILTLYIGLYIIFKNNNFFNKSVNTFNFFKPKSLLGVFLLFISIDSFFSIIDINNLPLTDGGIKYEYGGIVGYLISLTLSKLFGNLLIYFLCVITILSVILIVNFNYKAFVQNKDFKEEKNKENEVNIIKNTGQEISKNTNNGKDNLLDILNNGGNSKPKPNIKKVNKDISGDFSFNKVKNNIDFKLPPTSLLNPPQPKIELDNTENINNIKTIENTLRTFDIQAEVLNVSDGPTVSRYEIKLAEGIRVQKIVQLADNLAMSLAAIDVRIEAPIPGKSAIGIEVPKVSPTMVTLREIIEDSSFQKAKGALTFAIGKDVANKAIFADLAKMPHLLIAGATNSGKSVGLNTLIASLLYRMTPDELRFVMVDPKRVELSLYEGIPHLACPVIQDARLAAGALKSVEEEMDKRYKIVSEASSRNIESYNSKVNSENKLPYMVIVIDELADLMMQCSKDVEASICRIAQLARAVGIHLVVATQRPSVDVVTGKIKANIPSRIAFAVSSHTDSKIILDSTGADRLIGKGDMLFKPIDAQKPLRVQGCYLSETEINNLVLYLKEQRNTEYTFEPTEISQADGITSSNSYEEDELWIDVVKYVVLNGYCSTSMIQRKFNIGYNRAGKLVDTLEARGIVGPLNGAKPREVLIKQDDLDQFLVGKDNENL